MSISDSNVIDMVGIPSDDPTVVVLGISDHLEWGEKTYEHLSLMQEKINCYLRFIESGEIYSSFPSSKGKRPIIEILAKFEINDDRARNFMTNAKQILGEAGVELKHCGPAGTTFVGFLC